MIPITGLGAPYWTNILEAIVGITRPEREHIIVPPWNPSPIRHMMIKAMENDLGEGVKSMEVTVEPVQTIFYAVSGRYPE